MDDSPLPLSEISKRSNSSTLAQRHIKLGGGSRSVASGSRASASTSQVATGDQTCSPAPSCSASLRLLFQSTLNP